MNEFLSAVRAFGVDDAAEFLTSADLPLPPVRDAALSQLNVEAGHIAARRLPAGLELARTWPAGRTVFADTLGFVVRTPTDSPSALEQAATAEYIANWEHVNPETSWTGEATLEVSRWRSTQPLTLLVKHVQSRDREDELELQSELSGSPYDGLLIVQSRPLSSVRRMWLALRRNVAKTALVCEHRRLVSMDDSSSSNPRRTSAPQWEFHDPSRAPVKTVSVDAFETQVTAPVEEIARQHISESGESFDAAFSDFNDKESDQRVPLPLEVTFGRIRTTLTHALPPLQTQTVDGDHAPRLTFDAVSKIVVREPLELRRVVDDAFFHAHRDTGVWLLDARFTRTQALTYPFTLMDPKDERDVFWQTTRPLTLLYVNGASNFGYPRQQALALLLSKAGYDGVMTYTKPHHRVSLLRSLVHTFPHRSQRRPVSESTETSSEDEETDDATAVLPHVQHASGILAHLFTGDQRGLRELLVSVPEEDLADTVDNITQRLDSAKQAVQDLSADIRNAREECANATDELTGHNVLLLHDRVRIAWPGGGVPTCYSRRVLRQLIFQAKGVLRFDKDHAINRVTSRAALQKLRTIDDRTSLFVATRDAETDTYSLVASDNAQAGQRRKRG